MKSTKTFALIIVALMTAMLLTACGSTPIVTTTTRVVYKHPSVPEKFFEPVTVEKPIAYEDYMKLSLSERETYMREYAQKALKGLKASNNNVRDIKKVLDDTKKAAEHESQSGHQ